MERPRWQARICGQDVAEAWASGSPVLSVSMRMTRPFFDTQRKRQREPQLIEQHDHVVVSRSSTAAATAELNGEAVKLAAEPSIAV